MKASNKNRIIIYTTKAKCRDCYRCVRVCPVHAIRMESEQAQIVNEECISCGTCINECPQEAKSYATDYGVVLQMIEEGKKPVISIAPSYITYFTEWQRKRLASALRLSGFSYIAETALAAQHSASATAQYVKDNLQQNHLCSACPAVVNYVKNHAPEYTEYLVPVASPMSAHAAMIKENFPNTPFVFAGPCVAKKEEADLHENKGMIDAVLTFEEMEELFKLRGITFDNCEESNFDMLGGNDASLFPLEGGLLKTAGMTTDYLNSNVIAVSGFSDINRSLKLLTQKGKRQNIVEPLFCKHGCINGPFSSLADDVFLNREHLIESALEKNAEEYDPNLKIPDLRVRFVKTFHNNNVISDAEIQNVLNSIGKYKPEDELNCMACGYNSCREKAAAVARGMAVPEMCMPYMRQLAERKFDTLIKYDPNGIVTLNGNLEITHINDAFCKMFSCSDAIIGKHISYIVDPEPFEKLSTGSDDLIKQTSVFQNYNLVCHQMFYTLPDLEQYVGIFVDITNFQLNSEKLDEIKSETLQKANELIAHQIEMAQELAKFLGEHTSKGEALLNQLIQSTKK